jgi:hypothetical protein
LIDWLTSAMASLRAIVPPASRLTKKQQRSSKEKIDKLVTEGTRNYPAYLKLIYTGDSDFSDNMSEEDEGHRKQRHDHVNHRSKGAMDSNKLSEARLGKESSPGDDLCNIELGDVSDVEVNNGWC